MRITVTALAAMFFLAPMTYADQEPCSEPASFYIDAATLTLMSNDDTVTFYIGAPLAVRMTFAGGTHAQDMALVINVFTDCCHGLVASYDGVWPNRVKVSAQPGVWWKPVVGAQLSCEGTPLLYAEAEGGEGVYDIEVFRKDGLTFDLNCDGSVGVGDLLMLLQHWGPCPHPSQWCVGDFNSDGVVDTQDLLLLLANWG